MARLHSTAEPAGIAVMPCSKLVLSYSIGRMTLQVLLSI